MFRVEWAADIEINQFIKKHGGDYQSFFIGITDNPDRTLYKKHHLHESDKYICIETTDPQSAQRIVHLFNNEYGVKTSYPEINTTARTIYIYKIKPHTKP